MEWKRRIRHICSCLALAAAASLASATPASAIIRYWRNILPSNIVWSAAVATSPTAGAPSIILAGTSTGIRKSLDNGVTWTVTSPRIAYALAADPLNQAVAWAATDLGLYRSSDHGDSWTLVNSAIRNFIIVSPFDSLVLFGDNLKSTDGGASWTAMTGLPAPLNRDINIKCSGDPLHPGFLLALVNGWCYRSDDNGASWAPLGWVAMSVENDPVDARYYYLGGGVTEESVRYYPGGSSIMNFNDVNGIAVDPTDHRIVFLTTDSGTFISSDFGATFKAGGSGFSPDVPKGRMIFYASNGQLLLPAYNYGLQVKNTWCLDTDVDGYSPESGVCGPIDCDDAAPSINPEALENCLDGIDNNCNGRTDMLDAYCITLCSDRDLDGFLDFRCPGGDDCRDDLDFVHPGAPELCDGFDNDCNGLYDDGFDLDGDGYTSCVLDCDDHDPAVNPGEQETCGDAIDNNCDGAADEWCTGPALSWGDNAYGQLGDGTTSDRKSPVSLPISTYLIEAGGNHTLASPDGTVWAWGDNSKGQLGDGTNTARKTPIQVLDSDSEGYLQRIVAVSGGGLHSLAVNDMGGTFAWGDNSKGQLGDGTTTQRKIPAGIGGLGMSVAVAAGYKHSLSLQWDGTVYGWGDNSKGQLGDGTTGIRKVPVQTEGLTGMTAVSAGAYFSAALSPDGTVWTWGDNTKGQLGDGTVQLKKTPIQVAGLSSVVAIAAGWQHMLALKSDGTVWAWGDNSKGQLGDGTTTTRKLPVQVKNLSGVKAIACGDYHCLALDASGLNAWGYNRDGQLGDGTTVNRTTPVAVPGATAVVRMSAGAAHSLAVAE